MTNDELVQLQLACDLATSVADLLEKWRLSQQYCLESKPVEDE